MPMPPVPVVLPSEEDSVLLGTAIVAAAAAGAAWIAHRLGPGDGPPRPEIVPRAETAAMFDAQYRRFLLMQEHQRALRS